MPAKVHRTVMSNLSTPHMLIATATEDIQVPLGDIASAAFAHTSLLTVDSSTILRAAQKKHANGSGSRQLPIGRVPSKGPMKQRLHPGMLSTQDRATAHYGAVIELKATEDSMYLLSAGSDSRLRLWDVESGCDTLVNFETACLQINKPLQLATTQDSILVFVPCMRSVKVFDMWSGNTYTILRGHYEGVNSCWFNQQDQELYTGGNDRHILVWSPSKINR